MIKTYYYLINNSKSEGTYFVDDEYKVLRPYQKVTLEKKPVNVTSNITVSFFKKEEVNLFNPSTKKSKKEV